MNFSEMSDQALKALRLDNLAAAKSLTEHRDGMTDADEARFEHIMAEVDRIDAELASDGRKPVGPKIRNAMPVPTNHEGAVDRAVSGQTESRLGTFLRDVVENRAAYAEGAGATGGYTVPTILIPELIDRLRPAMVTSAAGARVMALEGYQNRIPRVLSDPSATWLGQQEGVAIPESEGSFDYIELDPKTLAFMVKVSVQLTQDSVLPLEQVLGNQFVAVMAHELDKAALFGAGTNAPVGLANVTGLPTVDLGANGAALTNYDPFVNARATLLAANATPSGVWLMSPRSDKELGLAKDSYGRYLDRPAAIASDRFLVTSAIPENLTHGTANTASVILGGNFADLYVGMRQQITVIPLRERFMDTLQIGFVVYARADVAVARLSSFVGIVGAL